MNSLTYLARENPKLTTVFATVFVSAVTIFTISTFFLVHALTTGNFPPTLAALHVGLIVLSGSVITGIILGCLIPTKTKNKTSALKLSHQKTILSRTQIRNPEVRNVQAHNIQANGVQEIPLRLPRPQRV